MFLDITIWIVFIYIAITDLFNQYIYTFQLIISLFLVLISKFFYTHSYIEPLLGSITGFSIGYTIYKISYYYYKEEAFGFGDVLLLSILGLYFEDMFIDYFSITYLLSGIILIPICIFYWDKIRKKYMPMAPIYVAGAFIFKFWGCPTLLNAYYDIYIYASAVISKVTMFFVLL